jgi:hypothetical protein
MQTRVCKFEDSPNGAVINTFLSSHTRERIVCLVSFFRYKQSACQARVSFMCKKSWYEKSRNKNTIRVMLLNQQVMKCGAFSVISSAPSCGMAFATCCVVMRKWKLLAHAL